MNFEGLTLTELKDMAKEKGINMSKVFAEALAKELDTGREFERLKEKEKILSDFDKGKQNLFDFLLTIQKIGVFDNEKFDLEFEKTKKFLNDPERNYSFAYKTSQSYQSQYT